MNSRQEDWSEPSEGLLNLIIGIRAGQLHGSGERNREAILAEFFEGDFGDLSETVAIEDIRDGVAHIEQKGGRPLYSSSARHTFCLAARALRAARRTWLPARRIPMLSRGHLASASRADTRLADSASRCAAFLRRRVVPGCSRAAFEVRCAGLLTWRPATEGPRNELRCSSSTFVALCAALEAP